MGRRHLKSSAILGTQSTSREPTRFGHIQSGKPSSFESIAPLEFYIPIPWVALASSFSLEGGKGGPLHSGGSQSWRQITWGHFLTTIPPMPSWEMLTPGVRGQRGSAKNTERSRRGRGISSAVEQSKKGSYRSAFKTWFCYCVTLHKLLRLPEPHTLH